MYSTLKVHAQCAQGVGFFGTPLKLCNSSHILKIIVTSFWVLVNIIVVGSSSVLLAYPVVVSKVSYENLSSFWPLTSPLLSLSQVS